LYGGSGIQIIKPGIGRRSYWVDACNGVAD